MAIKKKGVIVGAKKAAGVIAKAATYIPGVGGAVGSVVSDLINQGVPASTAMRMAGGRKTKKGLTYNEIRGAVKVLKLVKRFAPAGSRARLKMKRHRHTSY